MTAPGGIDPVRLARAVLTRVAEPAGSAVAALVTQHGPVGAVAMIREAAADGRAVSGCRADRATNAQAAADLAAAAEVGGRLVTPEDDEWPAAQVADLGYLHSEDNPAMPPVALWVRGPARLAEACAAGVSVVGARAATSYGTHVASELGYGLAAAGRSVLSGGAYGIDGAAHRGALAAGGCTIAVLACGIDRAYPPGHTALLDRIGTSGAVVSEWPPGSTPQRWRFLVRNRLIAALSAATVVVEAGARSGARQTARRADELSRAVLVVPGPVTSALSVGCHRLIREAGAVLVTGTDDVLAEIAPLAVVAATPVRGADRLDDLLSANARRVLDAVPTNRPAALADLAAESGLPVLAVARELSALEGAGLLEADGPGWRLTTAGKAR